MSSKGGAECHGWLEFAGSQCCEKRGIHSGNPEPLIYQAISHLAAVTKTLDFSALGGSLAKTRREEEFCSATGDGRS